MAVFIGISRARCGSNFFLGLRIIAIVLQIHVRAYRLLLREDVLLGLLHLLFFLNLDIHQHARYIGFHTIKHHTEQFKGFTLVFLLRIFLRITTQMDALTQVIQCR